MHDPLALSNQVRPEKLVEWHATWEDKKRKAYKDECARLGWSFVPFVLDVYGGAGAHAADVMQRLIRGLRAQREGWQHREVEAAAWQSLQLALARKIARQLVWSVFAVGEPQHAPATHSPYDF